MTGRPASVPPDDAAPDDAAPDDGAEPDQGPGVPSRWEIAAEHFARWRAGEVRAMDDLVRLMSPVLWHVVRAYGLDTAQAQDVVQTTWLTLVNRHASIAEERAVSGWLTTCARREAWRVRKLDRRADPVEQEVLEPQLPTASSAEDLATGGDQRRLLWRAVQQLTERCQRLLRVIAFEERPDYARIAADMAMPIGSIGPTRQRCLGKLRGLLEADGWEGGSDGTR